MGPHNVTSSGNAGGMAGLKNYRNIIAFFVHYLQCVNKYLDSLKFSSPLPAATSTLSNTKASGKHERVAQDYSYYGNSFKRDVSI